MKSIYQALADLETHPNPAVLCTVVHTSGSTPRHSTSKMLVYPDGSILGTIGGGGLENQAIQDALASLQTQIPVLRDYKMVDPSRGDVGICGGTVTVFFEPLLPSPTALIIGGGHVGKAVTFLAGWLGFSTIVSDDRPEFCTQDANPYANRFIVCNIQELPNKVTITPQTFLVLTTRGSNIDVLGLPALLKTDASYIGVIGSRRRWAETTKQLAKIGISKETLSRVHSPIGVKIGAETPEEIALSIMTEILMIRNNHELQSKKTTVAK